MRADSKFAALRQNCSRLPHGTRGRYVSGCHCMLCRAANSRYNTEREAARRAGDCGDIVSSKDARQHLLALARKGVGYKSVAEACDVAASILFAIRSGRRQRIRASTARKILSVDIGALSGGALVSARATWRRLDQLIADGYTRAQLALWLGKKTPALQIRRDRVTAKTAADVRRLYQMIQDGKFARQGWRPHADR